MSKSKFKVGLGLAQNILTGEPVYVTAINDKTATVLRPVVTRDGIEYKAESFLLEMLETREAAAKRNFEFEEFVMNMREEADEKRYADAMPKGLQALNPPTKLSN